MGGSGYLTRPEWALTRRYHPLRMPRKEPLSIKSTQTLSKVQWSMFASRLLHRASRLHEGLKAGCFFANRAHPYWLKKKKSKSYAGFSQSCLDNLDSWTRFTDPSVWLLQLRRGKPNSRTLARLFWQVRKFLRVSAGAPAPPAHRGACYTYLKVWALSTCTCRCNRRPWTQAALFSYMTPLNGLEVCTVHWW